jgi:WD40 repeat protein
MRLRPATAAWHVLAVSTEHPVVGSEPFLQAGHEESVEAAGFSSHLPLAATGSIDGKLIIWDCGTFTERGVCQHDEVSLLSTGSYGHLTSTLPVYSEGVYLRARAS